MKYNIFDGKVILIYPNGDKLEGKFKKTMTVEEIHTVYLANGFANELEKN